MAQWQPIRRLTSDIPDKLYFRIGEVSRICEVPAYVLRFWETEFIHLRPNKGGTGQRLYRRRDVETALRIKRLLYDEGYTIPGARQILKSEAKQKLPQLSLPTNSTLPAQTRGQIDALKKDLASLLALLSGDPAAVTPRALRTTHATRQRPLAGGARLERALSAGASTLFEAESPIPPGPADDHSSQVDRAPDAAPKETRS